MGVALRVYEAFKNDEAKAKVLAEAFEEIEEHYLLKEEAATSAQLEHVNLNLKLEIENVRKEIKEVEGRLSLEIEKVRREIKEVESRLSLEIEKVRSDVIKYMNRQTLWIIGAVSVIIGMLKALDYVLK